MFNFFEIDGYFKDDGTEFTGYVVTDAEEIIEDRDDDIFWYGLTEDMIKEYIDNPPLEGVIDFVITSYRKIS